MSKYRLSDISADYSISTQVCKRDHYNNQVAYSDFLEHQVFADFVEQFTVLQVSSTLVAFLCNLHKKTAEKPVLQELQYTPIY